MGAFRDLLDEAQALGAEAIDFRVVLSRSDEAPTRWFAECDGDGRIWSWGRTGEEALRNLVERLKGREP